MPFEIWKRSPLIFSLEYTLALVVREFAIRSNFEERDPRERLYTYNSVRLFISFSRTTAAKIIIERNNTKYLL